MQKPPKHLFMELQTNEKISQAALLEAAMTYLKLEANQPDKAQFLHIYPELIGTREEMFFFAMEFGRFLDDFKARRRQVPPPIKQMFYQTQNSQN